MISALRSCPKCGWEIPADAPEGGCPGCLLESGLRLLDQESLAAGDNRSHEDKPARAGTRSERFAELLGELGDYELLEEVGRGGQGVVFRARQKNLDRTVALKVISLGQWASEAHLKRFRREAHAAASLDHPGIVPIYDVGERDGSCYFSMKFVEGGQLDEVVGRTPISVRQAAELIAKVARTVNYAHEHGILHRDIKPGNILLDQAGEPHLTDFGLARLVETESTITRTLDVLGTPSYMAPEQATGETTKLSKATDVYGLGAVLYQLLTGQPPFAGGTTYETIRLLRETEPRQPRALNPKVDRDLSAICLKCLEKDPARRYSSALALAEDLEHWLRHEPIQAKPSGFFTHARKWVRRNPSTTVFVTLLVALGASLGVMVWNHKSVPLIPKSVAVLPFENLSDDPDNAYFAEGIQDEILTRLASVADLKVISRTSTQRYHSKPGNLVEIAKQLGVANIIEGSVQKVTDQVRVNVQLINAQTDSHLWADTYDQKLTDIFSVESQIAIGIAAALQAKLTGREEQTLAAKPTNNPEAYDAYLQGLALGTRPGPLGDLLGEVIDSYERAVQLDPNFAIAWAQLSNWHGVRYYNSNDPADRDAAKRSLEKAQELEPNSPETLLALGYYQYRVLRDYGAAKTTFGRVSELSPSNSDVPYALGRVARQAGHWDESIPHYERALSLDPRNVGLLSNAAATYGMLRQFPGRAKKLYDRILDIAPNDPDVMAQKVGIYYAQGNLEEAARSLTEINWQTSPSGAFLTKITQLRLERSYGEAIRLLKARLIQFHSSSEYAKADNQLDFALMQSLNGDTAGAKVTAGQARDALEPLYRDKPDDPLLTERLSGAYAWMGEKDLALNLAERAVVLRPRAKDAALGPTFEENLALIQTICGDNSHAISALTQLLQIPYLGSLYDGIPITAALLRLDPIWDPLRADPAFQKLCEEKIDKSIAVLPFQNLSDEKANAYFAEGIQDEILTKLATVRDLKVISRTSTTKYQSKPDNLKTVAQELGVSNILEGAVQRAGDKVRVNAQLIDARADTHLWAKSYDRDFKDVLAVESEVAAQIADALKANLSPSESHALAAARTENTEAYDFFLRGQYEFHQAESSLAADAYDRADAFYRQALARDPDFAEAAAELARNRLSRHWFVSPLAAAELEEVKSLIDRALALAPNSPEAHFALGLFFYWGHRQYDNALAEFNRTLELQPNNADARAFCAWVYRRRGEWERSLADSQQAEELNPRDASIPTSIGITYNVLRLWKDAERAELRALAIDPHNIQAAIFLVLTRLATTGDVDSARRALDDFPEVIKAIPGGAGGPRGATGPGDISEVIEWPVYLDVIERRFTDAFQAVEKEVVNDDRSHLQQLAVRVAIRVLAGDPEAAKSMGEEALPLLEARFRERPDDTFAMTELSWVYLALGRNADAVRLSRQAADTIPIEKDALAGPNLQIGLAQIEARAGAPEEAIKRLRRLLSIPAGGTASIALLKIDPVWDPIRNRPDFQQLLSGPEQIGPNK